MSKKIPKVIEVEGENAWVLLIEYPDGSLSLEGIRVHDEIPKAYQRIGVRFSREAIKKLIPEMIKWLEETG